MALQYIAMVPLFSIRVVSDSFTSISLCIILYDARPTDKSSELVRKLIMYAMNRFVMTTQVFIGFWSLSLTISTPSNRIVVLVQTIVLVLKPETIWAIAIDLVSVEIYVNSFLSTLNSRNHLRDMGNGTGRNITLSVLCFKTTVDQTGDLGNLEMNLYSKPQGFYSVSAQTDSPVCVRCRCKPIIDLQ
ncbi:hypothetical protein C8J56DRAFT_1061919 [Mycena floridula]|nr:hypothetical protein C8J56DRAFT_1061919 [Mycena floridula]